jgi:signal peptidase I
MKSSLFVAFMIKFRQDFTEYKSSEKPMKTLHFSPLVLFLLHYEFIFTPMRVHGISMEFVLSSCLC